MFFSGGIENDIRAESNINEAPPEDLDTRMALHA